MASVSSQDAPTYDHLLLHCFGGWGHIRPLCNLAARVVKAKRVNVTFLISPSYYNQTKLELSRHFGSDDEHSKHIRLIGLKEDVTVASVEAGDRLFDEVYKSIVDSGSLTCSVSKSTFENITHPDSAIIDFYGFGPFQAIRRASKRHVKVFVWHVAALSYLLRVFSPITDEGIGGWEKYIQTQADSTGKNFIEAADDILAGGHGSVVEIPGMPKLYDWELFPQPLPSYPMGIVSTQMYHLLRACDGIIHITAEAYEPVFIAAFEKWFGEGRKSYVLGPILPDAKEEAAKSGELSQSAKAKDILEHLDKSLEKQGPKSVLYISFGSFAWPAEPEKLWAFIDIVMDMQIPFILSHGSPHAVVPPELVARADKLGLGIFSKWSPQQIILDHEATGWFMSHCGQNSVLESLSSGVPLIAWPYAIDQVTNAIHVSTNLNVGYELAEVRSGDLGLKTIHRTGKAPEGTIEAVRREATEVLTLARGRDGEAKRKNISKLRLQLADAWAENGPATTNFDQFVNDLRSV